MKLKSQEEIIQDILHGDGNRALGHLYDQLLPKIRGYVMKNSGSRDEANDVFQDTVILFFNRVKSNRYDSSYDIQGYLYTTARNLWVDKMRRERRMVKFEFNGQYEDASNQQDLLDEMIDQEKTSAMATVFQKLDEKCRKILLYFIYEKRSMKEISVLMGYSSEDVAKTNHYRCKQYLTKLVKNDPELVSLLRH